MVSCLDFKSALCMFINEDLGVYRNDKVFNLNVGVIYYYITILAIIWYLKILNHK